MNKTPISVYCPYCGWQEPATWWNVDKHDDGSFYPIIVCSECYKHIKLTYS